MTTTDDLTTPESLARQEHMLAALLTPGPSLDGHPLFAPVPRVSDTILAAATSQALEETLAGRPLASRLTLSRAVEVADMVDRQLDRSRDLA